MLPRRGKEQRGCGHARRGLGWTWPVCIAEWRRMLAPARRGCQGGLSLACGVEGFVGVAWLPCRGGSGRGWGSSPRARFLLPAIPMLLVGGGRSKGTAASCLSNTPALEQLCARPAVQLTPWRELGAD